MNDIPKFALSVRQPWAHAIVMGWKPVENRDWRRPNPGLNFRGSVAIHASSGMTQDEYLAATRTFEVAGFTCPPPALLTRGAIIGTATVIDVVDQHKNPGLLSNPWFFGPRALLLGKAVALDEPTPCDGALGFFEWKRADRAIADPKPWMLKPPYVAQEQVESTAGRLL